ncbi:hypothetical protein Tco_1099790, partial [Tanacetum coccineum]
MRLDKALLDFNSNQEKRLSRVRSQLGQIQDDMIGKINLLWKTVSEKLNDVSTPKNARNSMAPKSIAEEDEMETNVEVKEIIEEEESEFETTEEVEEILKEEEEDEDDENFNSFPTMKELSHHECLLKNPRPR